MSADRRLVWLGLPLALLLFRGALAGETLVGADLFLFNLPQLEVLERAYRAGGVPGWGATLGLGQPLLADPCIAAHYPGHALVLLARPVVALGWLLALHVVLAHAGAYRLARRLGCSPLAAALAGLTFAGGGVMQSHVHGPALLLAAAWMPWAVLATGAALAPGAPRTRLFIAAAPFALSYLAGSPELTACSGVLAWAFAAGAARGPRGAARATLGLLVIALLAVALAASTIAPFAAVVRDTNRAAGLGYDAAATWSLHPLELLGLATPGPFSRGGASPRLLGHEQRTWYLSLYLGAAGAALAAVGVASLRRRGGDRRLRLLALAAAALLVLAFGRWGGLHPLLFDLLPPVRSFRYPAKVFVPVALCLSLLAGVGLDALRAAPRWTAFGAVLAVDVVVALGATLAGDAAPLALRAGVAALAALAAGRAALRGRWRLVLALTLAELALHGLGMVEPVPAATYETPPALAAPVVAAQREAGLPARVATTRRASQLTGAASEGLSPRLAGQRSWREALVPNTGMSVGVRSVFGFSSFLPARVAALQPALADAPLARYYRLFGATHLVHAQDEALEPGEAAPVASLGPWALSRLVQAPPWAAVYDSLRLARARGARDPRRAGGRPARPAGRGGRGRGPRRPRGLGHRLDGARRRATGGGAAGRRRVPRRPGAARAPRGRAGVRGPGPRGRRRDHGPGAPGPRGRAGPRAPVT